ncbi:MAG: hypothetical protein V3T26_05960 [candidate division NC10 bacterium]
MDGLIDYLRSEHGCDLVDEAVLGGRIDSDVAEIATEFEVSKMEVYRAINRILCEEL